MWVNTNGVFVFHFQSEIMAQGHGTRYEEDEWDYSARSPSKRARNAHLLSKSEAKFHYEEGDNFDDRFQNPDSFMRQFGGYESSNSEDPDDDEIKEDQKSEKGINKKKKKRECI
jgi:hypothetical protein